ncbi:MAG: tetratricopeptide repeat protein [Planctomycetes bacterium]|nr:tetratricopeptide repeat protein [Planctomycetota bacterium]
MLLFGCGGSQENTRWLDFSQGREFLRAQALRREGRLDEARRLFGNLRRIDPGNVAAFREEIDLSRGRAEREALREELELLLERDDDASARAAHLALLASLVDDRVRKERMLAEAIELDEACSVAHAEMAISLEERREDDAAYRSWKQAAEGRVPSPRVFRRLAALEEARHNDGEAIRLYQNYLLLDPDDVWVRAKLGALYLADDAPDRAEEQLRRAFELDSQDVTTIVNLAVAMVRNGRVAEGLELMLRAERLEPKAPDIQENLGLIYADKLGDYAKAIEHYQRYLDLGGEDRMRVEGWIRAFEERLDR